MTMPGLTEWMIIAGIVALLFGGAKLPSIGRGLGGMISEFKKAMNSDSEKPKEISSGGDAPKNE